MDETALPANQADARRLGLPRVVWEAMPYRLVEFYEEDDDRIHLDLERWDGDDRMGQSRWAVVRKPHYDDAQGAPGAYHWADAFWALAASLLVSRRDA